MNYEIRATLTWITIHLRQHLSLDPPIKLLVVAIIVDMVAEDIVAV